MQWKLWVQWLLINMLSFAVAAIVSLSIIQATLGAVLLAGAIVGAIAGAFQENLLGSKISNWGGQWIVLTMLGGGIGWPAGATGSSLLGDVLSLSEDWRSVVYVTLNGAGIGIIVGLFQVIALRRKTAKAGWWVLASMAGRAMGWLAGFWAVSLNLFSPVLAEIDLGTFALAGAIGGSVYGSITGFALVWLLRNPRNA